MPDPPPSERDLDNSGYEDFVMDPSERPMKANQDCVMGRQVPEGNFSCPGGPQRRA